MDVVLLICLIVLNGVLAMLEISIVSSRKSRLQKLADDGSPGAQSALELSNEPSGFLSTIQVGITTVGILSGAIGKNALADPLTTWLSDFDLITPYARGLALTIVVVGLTYFSVVVGELVPKRLGLLAPESIAAMIAAPMTFLARMTRPVAWILSSSSTLLLRVIGARHRGDPPVSNDEIYILMEQGSEAGIFHQSEQAIVSNVLRLDEQRISAIMTHRNDIYVLDLDQPEEDIRQWIAESPYTRIVVCRDGLEHIVGILRTADLLKLALAGDKLDVESYLRTPLYVPERVTTTHLMENFRKAGQQCALIIDEYGELQGLVTLTDVLTAIVGELPSSDVAQEQEQDRDNQQSAFDQILLHRIDGLIDQYSAVIDRLRYDSFRQVAIDLLYALVDSLRYIAAVLANQHKGSAEHHLLAVLSSGTGAQLLTQAHLGHITDAHRNTIGVLDDDVGDVSDIADLSRSADQVLLAAAFDVARTNVGIIALQRNHNVLQAEAMCDQALRLG